MGSPVRLPICLLNFLSRQTYNFFRFCLDMSKQNIQFLRLSIIRLSIYNLRLSIIRLKTFKNLHDTGNAALVSDRASLGLKLKLILF